MSAARAARADRPDHYRTRRPRAQAHQDADLLAYLREAVAANPAAPLTVKAYGDFARESGSPTSQTHINRFGSWRAALEAAGLAAHPASGVAGRGRFTAEVCAAAVARCARKLKKTPTAVEYQAYAAERGPRTPSLSTVRKACRGWEEALRQAGF